MAKSRSAPLKSITIPRMELSAAVVSTRLDRMIKQELMMPIDSSTYWTDSTCVLRYLENKETRFQTFVANRISTILDQSETSQWRFVDGSLNPADEASRGMTGSELLSNRRWKQGPDFLMKSENEWPQRPIDLGQIPNNDPEVKSNSTVCANNVIAQDSISKVIDHHSSWNSLRKTIAWLLRYKSKLRKAVRRSKSGMPLLSEKTVTPITVLEINGAESAIVKHIQQQCFGNDQVALRKKTSSIYKLDPILVEGIVRVGGRFHNAPIAIDKKHQIILPKKSPCGEIDYPVLPSSVWTLWS
ncbi:uncharacterized protein LOC117125238 [Anneissia japonica]|uniref:uncharacterized protein LOC117125238 n=1 Tax=Anneissia japonica TaxID=1529436 RepID=UPI001425B8D6|nr:uncharacterized protein LOC117125238 [Anneissia japonica]